MVSGWVYLSLITDINIITYIIEYSKTAILVNIINAMSTLFKISIKVPTNDSTIAWEIIRFLSTIGSHSFGFDYKYIDFNNRLQTKYYI